MEILVTAIVAVLLTAVVIVVSRAGSNRHQEDLVDHRGSAAPPASGDGREQPRAPKSDRPAGPDAEAMGVAGAGAPSVDPSAERRD